LRVQFPEDREDRIPIVRLCEAKQPVGLDLWMEQRADVQQRGVVDVDEVF
jgi:hypothetical protein|tara:strand:+ start:17184 stop:17333 length:150 start_codon:yes stop_codon:yes gene_type:complete